MNSKKAVDFPVTKYTFTMSEGTLKRFGGLPKGTTGAMYSTHPVEVWVTSDPRPWAFDATYTLHHGH